MVLPVLICLATPALAGAACGDGGIFGPRRADATLVIGDSVTLGAARQLAALGFRVDARECRRFGQGLALLRATRLPSSVVLALGSNPPVSASEVESAISIAGPDRSLALVLPRELGGARRTARVIRAAAARHDGVTLIDWPAASAGHPAWFAADGLHLQPAGASALAGLIRSSLAAATQQGLQTFDATPGPSAAPAGDTRMAESGHAAGALFLTAWHRIASAANGLRATLRALPDALTTLAGGRPAGIDPIAPVRRNRGHLPPWAT